MNEKRSLFGVEYSIIDYGSATAMVHEKAFSRSSYGVSALAVHGLTIAVRDSWFREQLAKIQMIVPDGQPIRWTLNSFYGSNLKDRVYGPQLMLNILEMANKEGLGVYFFGSTASTLDKLCTVIETEYPLAKIRGVHVVDLNWLLISNDFYGADLVCSTLMNIDPFTIPYLAYGFRRLGIKGIDQFRLNTPFEPFCSNTSFYVKRAWTDYPGLLTFRSRFLAYVGYESPLAGFLQWLLYLFREPFYDYGKPKDPQ